MSWCKLGQFLKWSETPAAIRKVTERRRRFRAKFQRKQETVKKEERSERVKEDKKRASGLETWPLLLKFWRKW